jgi:hypothetical protein
MDHLDDSSEPVNRSREVRSSRHSEADLLARFEGSTGGAAVDGRLLPDQLCRAVVSVLSVDGAAISVYLGDDIAVPIGASDLDATTGEALQFTLREGPCFEAYSSRKPVLLPDLANADSRAWSQWPTYTQQLTRRTSYQGVFAYPLLANGLAMGSLSLYGASRGNAGAVGAVTDIAARVADRLLEAELLASPDGQPEHPWMEGPASRRRRQVWVAQGLTVRTNQLTPGQAIDLLRAQAYAADRLLDDFAADIVAGRLPVPVLEADQ